METTEGLKNLISKYDLWQKSLKPVEGVQTLHVDEVASKVAAFYEQIRTIIDWKEEHLMRRAAIIRKLKRKFSEVNSSSAENLSESLVLDLIRGGFFPNDKIEEHKPQEVQKIIDKYTFIIQNNPEINEEKSGKFFYNRILEIAACEIEETLSPSIKEMALIDFMFNTIKDHILINNVIHERGLIKKEDKDILIYIAIQQALFKLDSPIITYNLIKYKYSFWENPSEEDLLKISQNIINILKSIEIDLSHPFLKKIYNICEKYDTAYLVISDVLVKNKDEDISEKIKEPKLIEKDIRQSYENRLKQLKARITRAAVYSVASIFVTKIVSLLLLEIIIAKITNEGINYIFLTADVLIPTLLMTFLVLTVKSPSRNNINVVVMETIKIIYQDQKIDNYEIKISKKRGLIGRIILSLIYSTGSLISFGVIFLIFNYFHFPVISMIINFIFIALILFAGTAIQKVANELTMEEIKEGVIEFISDVLFLPVTEIGRWMSETWKQYNIIASFFNAMIDMPFSAFVEFIERWRYFIKERKEDLR